MKNTTQALIICILLISVWGGLLFVDKMFFLAFMFLPIFGVGFYTFVLYREHKFINYDYNLESQKLERFFDIVEKNPQALREVEKSIGFNQ